MDFYRRNLLHWQPDRGEFIVTARLNGSLPADVVVNLKEYKNQRKRTVHQHKFENLKDIYQKKIQQQIFQKYEDFLDNAGYGPTWLKDDPVATIVQDAFHFRDGEHYDLYTYTIMNNHIHVVLRVLKSNFNNGDNNHYQIQLTNIMRNFKRHTARQANLILNRRGAFWQPESFDRFVRDANELERAIFYTIHDPIKAGLATKWEDWPYTYCKSEFIEFT